MFIQKNILQSSEIPSGVKSLIRTLHHDFTDRVGECFPSVSTIAIRMSVSRRSVQRYIKQAIELRLLSVRRRWLKTSVYRLLCLVRPKFTNKGDTVSSKLNPLYKNNVNENASVHSSRKEPPNNDLVREIESLVGSSKDRACWNKVVQACSRETVHRAISGLKIAMNEISLRRPAAYLVSILKAEHGPGLFGGSNYQHSSVAVSPTAVAVEPLRPLSESQWRDNMVGIKAIMSRLRC